METLDSESQQISEVYAHFGLALYLAQCVEQAIIQNLVFFDLYPETSCFNGDHKTWSEKNNEFEATELKRMTGMLIKRLKNEGETTEAVELQLEEVLTKRNWLIHRYFNDRALDFAFEEGRKKIIIELDEIKTLFRHVDKLILKVTMPIARRLGVTEEVLAKKVSNMLKKHKKASVTSPPIH